MTRERAGRREPAQSGLLTAKRTAHRHPAWPSPPSRRRPPRPARPPRRVLAEVLFQALTRAAGLFVLALVAGLVGVLVCRPGRPCPGPASTELFTSTDWVPKPPGGGDPTFGSLAFVWGTVATSVIAMLIAVPLGVASAAFLSEIAPAWVRRVGAFLIELLAAIPSVVYGFWGLFFLAPVVQEPDRPPSAGRTPAATASSRPG